MAFEMFYYDNAKKPSDFNNDPFFQLDFFPSSEAFTPCSTPVLHKDGYIYFGAYISTQATGYLCRFPPNRASDNTSPEIVLRGIDAPVSILSWRGSVWFWASDGSTTGTLYRWNGKRLKPMDTGGTAGNAKLGHNGDSIYVASCGTANKIRRVPNAQDPDDNNVAANLTMPSTSFGVSTNLTLPQLVGYKGKLYIIGADTTGTVIYSVDGNTVASANAPTGIPYSMVKFDHYLFYICGTALGRFDGTSWVDAHYDLTIIGGTKLASYSGTLTILDSTACHASDGTDTSTFTATASTTDSTAHPYYATGNGPFYVVY